MRLDQISYCFDGGGMLRYTVATFLIGFGTGIIAGTILGILA